MQWLMIGRRGDEVDHATWVDHRRNGDYRRVSRSQLRESDVDTAAAVLLDEDWYAVDTEAGGSDATWSVWDVDAAPTASPRIERPLVATEGPSSESVSQPLLQGMEDDATVMQQPTVDGGSRWTVEDEAWKRTWSIHPDGYLRFVTVEYRLPEDVAVSVSASREPGVLQWIFTPVADPEPIGPPTPGAGLDLDGWHLPDVVDLGD